MRSGSGTLVLILLPVGGILMVAWEGLDFLFFFEVSVWVCFRGLFVVWRVFPVCFGVVLVLNSYCIA